MKISFYDHDEYLEFMRKTKDRVMAVRDVSDHLLISPLRCISTKMYFHDCMPVLPLIVQKDHKQGDHIFEKLNSLSFPGYFKLFP